MRVRGAVIALIAGLSLASSPHAQEQPRKWGVSPYLGLHQPSLEKLNEGVFTTPYEGTAQFIDPTANNQSGEFTFETPLPEFYPGSLAGLEFQWRFNDKHTLILGAGTWEATSSVHSTNQLPVQGVLQGVSATRKADLSYVEYYLGWRYNLITRPGRYRIYTTANLHQLYDIDYREDFSGVFLTGDLRTFRKTTVIIGQSTGLILLEGMAGGEWFINDWFSLGIEGGYGFGLNRIEFTNNSAQTDFLDTDNISLSYPTSVGADGRMDYRAQAGGSYKDLKLNFNGWKTLLKATVYF